MARAGDQRSDDAQFVVRDLATLKALADPLRRSILTLLDTARTVKDISAQLGRPADRLYYHLGLLEKHGLVRAIEERGSERRYVAAADVISIDPTITMPTATANHLVTNALEDIRAEYVAAIRRTKPGGKKRVMLLVKQVDLTDDERAELMQRLETVADDYMSRKKRRRSNGRGDDAERTTFGVVTGLWPIDDGTDQ